MRYAIVEYVDCNRKREGWRVFDVVAKAPASDLFTDKGEARRAARKMNEVPDPVPSSTLRS